MINRDITVLGNMETNLDELNENFQNIYQKMNKKVCC